MAFFRRTGKQRRRFKSGAIGATWTRRGTMAQARAKHARLKRRFGGATPVFPVVVPGFTRNTGFFGRFGPEGELKFKDQDFNSGTIAVGGTVSEQSIVDVAQGTAEDERIGRKCTIRSINWRFEIRLLNQANTGAPGVDVIRVIMYLDKQCNGATATVTEILESNDYQSFNNLANKSRFRTLMDRTYALNLTAASGADATAEWTGTNLQDTFFKKVNIPIEFDSTTGAITEIRSNNIGILLLSRAGLSDLNSKIRLRFSDN